MPPDILDWVVKSKAGKITVAIYGIGLVIFLLPQVVIGLRQGVPHLARQYREAFTGANQKKEPLLTDLYLPLVSGDPAVRKKLADLEGEMVRLRNTGSTARIDSLDAAIKELRATLFGDPERVLTIQRINAEQTALVSRVDSLQTQMQWLFGISMTLALGVLAVVVSVVKSSFERKPDDRKA